MKGSQYFRNCERIENSFSFSTPAAAATKENFYQSKRKICSDISRKRLNWKSLYKKGFCKESVCEHSISSKEKGWGQQTCHQFEEPKSVQLPSLFQNGDPVIIQKILKQGNSMRKLGHKHIFDSN